jgi:hypothetical protein
VYVKTRNKQLVGDTVNALLRKGYAVHVIEYGRHSLGQYRAALWDSGVMIMLGGSESQGISLLEAWASDVPTLVFDPDTAAIQLGDGEVLRLQRPHFSAAPYLNEARGRFWRDHDDLFNGLAFASHGVNPRDDLGQDWSDEACTRKLLNLLAPTQFP